MKELKKQIAELLHQKLSIYGFKKKGQWEYVRTVENNNVIQIIGLTFSHPERDVIAVSLTFWIIYKNINEVAMKFGEPDCCTKYYRPMVATTISDLIPGTCYREWCFTLKDDYSTIADNTKEIVDVIIQYGFPYFETTSKESNLIDEIKRYGDDGRLIPIIYYIHNEKAKALEHIEKHIKKKSEWPTKEDYESAKRLAGEGGHFVMVENNALKYYMEFVENFKRILNEENVDSVSKENLPDEIN